MRIHRSLLVAIGVVLCALTTVPLAAQQTESRIVGPLLDESRSALPGVTVTVTATDTGIARTTVTEADGSFAVTNLARGTYVVRGRAARFREPYAADRARRRPERGARSPDVGGRAHGGRHGDAQSAVLDISSAKLGVNVSPRSS